MFLNTMYAKNIVSNTQAYKLIGYDAAMTSTTAPAMMASNLRRVIIASYLID